MKHFSAYKSLYALMVLLIVANVCMAQGSRTVWTEKTAKAWLKERVWANGLKLNPEQPLNVMEFARQYELNKTGWDKVIAFLRDRNLELMAPGKYPIDGDNIFAIITEPEPKKLDTAGFETHKNFIDLHYVISGKEDIYTQGKKDLLVITKPYDETKDVQNYYIKGKAHTATPDYFFLFFPAELHQAGIRSGGKVKKLVIKIRAVN
nr:YhcH/YjgK/YiaL family protein [uncultured Mucilaginibacter sp.]